MAVTTVLVTATSGPRNWTCSMLPDTSTDATSTTMAVVATARPRVLRRASHARPSLSPNPAPMAANGSP